MKGHFSNAEEEKARGAHQIFWRCTRWVQARCKRRGICRLIGASPTQKVQDASQSVQKQNWHLFCLFRFGNNSSVRCSNEKNETGHGRQRDGGRTHAGGTAEAGTRFI